MRSNLHDVVVALHLSKVVFNRIKMNFVWALGYNLFALPFAAGVFYPWTDWRIPPAFAGFMMAFSSVSVVVSSLLLKFYSKPTVDENRSGVETGLSSRHHVRIGQKCCQVFSFSQPKLMCWIRLDSEDSEDIEDSEDSINGRSIELSFV